MFSMEHECEIQLMRAHIRGEERAFEVLFRKYAPVLTGYFQRRGLSTSDAQDLVQQTFLQLHRARDQYREGEPLRPWLFTIARNVSRDHGRRRQRRPETFCDLDQYEAPVREADHLHTERTRALALALEQLPREPRKLLNQHWFEERSFSEIAHREGTHSGTLRVRAHRACLQLRKLLERSPECA
jgi:RNA polymerase sigma-70 factor (ECF subfamily)